MNFVAPPMILALIATNVLIFLASSLTHSNLDGWLALWPFATGNFRWWQPVTYAFLHVDVSHVFFNMLGVAMFGSDLERLWGPRRLAALYFVSVLAAAATQLLVTSAMHDVFPTVGASGGVFGLLVAYGMAFPRRRVTPLIPPIPMSARTFVVIYALAELFFGVTGTFGSVAHFAHLGGLFGGWAVLRWWRWRSQAPTYRQ